MKCWYCLLESDDLVRDHVVPRSRGGPDNAFNIVMACQACNSAKADKLPSEWLGDRCPDNVLEIEHEVNRRLENRFSARDRKRPVEYAFWANQNGFVLAVGTIIGRSGANLRIKIIDPFILLCGRWRDTEEVIDVAAKECRVFLSKAGCLEAAMEIVNYTLHYGTEKPVSPANVRWGPP